MKHNFDACLEAVLKHEGGYVNHPKDPGGPTNMGITLATLAEYRNVPLSTLTADDVKRLTISEASGIYRVKYWNRIRGDELPEGVDLAVFDFAVNSGPGRAIKFLQRVIGTLEDGVLGPLTMEQVEAEDDLYTIHELCRERLFWLRHLSTFPTFGKGWTRRVEAVADEAEKMALKAHNLDTASRSLVQALPVAKVVSPTTTSQISPTSLLARLVALFTRKAA